MMADQTATAWRAAGAALRIAVAVAACVVVAPAAALARCDWDYAAAEGIQAASIRARSPRVHFVQDAVMRGGCPNESAGCRAHAFLTPNDMVLAAPSQGAYTGSVAFFAAWRDGGQARAWQTGGWRKFGQIGALRAGSSLPR